MSNLQGMELSYLNRVFRTNRVAPTGRTYPRYDESGTDRNDRNLEQGARRAALFAKSVRKKLKLLKRQNPGQAI